MALNKPGDLVARLQKMEQAVSPKSMKPRLVAVAVKMKPIGPQAAAADLGGDAMFSGWPEAGRLEVQFKMHASGPGLTMHRAGRSAGAWRVAEDGRHPFVGALKPNITKTGKLAKRQKQRGRYNGTTAGFGSWTKAETAMAAAARPLMRRAETKAVVDAFRGK